MARLGRKPVDAMALLLRMQEASRARALGQPGQDPVAQTRSGLGFRVADWRLLVPLDEVAEILPIPDATRAPGVHGCIRGVANVRGSLITVLDLSDFLGMPARAADARERLLILADPALQCGLIVQEVFGMRHFEVDSERVGDDTLPAPLGPFLGETYERDRIRWRTFDLRGFAATETFRSAALEPSHSG